MAARLQTAIHPVAQIFCNRYEQLAAYTNWRPQGSGDWLLIYTQGGAGLFTTSLGQLKAEAGHAVLFAPGDSQDYITATPPGRWDLSWAHFRPRAHWEPLLQWPHHACGLRHLDFAGQELREPWEKALDRMVAGHSTGSTLAQDLASNGLEEALVWAQLAARQFNSPAEDDRVRRAADLLVTRLAQPYNLEQVAAACGLSASRLAHLFVAARGVSPRQFQEQKRLEYAAQLLRVTSLDIAEIARQVGYTDAFYFSNRFRKHTGQSPMQFRKTQTRGPASEN